MHSPPAEETKEDSLEKTRGRFAPADFVVETGCEVIVGGNSAFAVPRGSPDGLLRYLVGAHKAYCLGYKSVDYCMQRFGDWLSVRRDEEISVRLVHEGTAKVRGNVVAIAQKRETLRDLPDRFGLVVSGAALLRAESTFKAACLLCEMTMGFEAFCLGKLILEQIAWAYAIHKIKDDTVYKVKPSTCIKCLKGMYPQAGRLYGFLNMQAHMDPKTIHDFLKPGEDDMVVVLRSSDKCILACIFLLQLADMYGACMEAVFKTWYKTFEFIRKGKRPVQLKTRRRSRIEVLQFRKTALEYLKKKNNSVA